MYLYINILFTCTFLRVTLSRIPANIPIVPAPRKSYSLYQTSINPSIPTRNSTERLSESKRHSTCSYPTRLILNLESSLHEELFKEDPDNVPEHSTLTTSLSWNLCILGDIRAHHSIGPAHFSGN